MTNNGFSPWYLLHLTYITYSFEKFMPVVLVTLLTVRTLRKCRESFRGRSVAVQFLVIVYSCLTDDSREM